MMLKNVVLSVLFASLTLTAHADTNKDARKLLTNLKAKQQRTLETPLLNFTLSPSAPLAGQEVSLIVQPETVYSESRILLSAKLDGVDKGLIHPSENLWILHASSFSEAKAHQVEVSVSIENKKDADRLIKSIDKLATEILNLQKKIDKETDPQKKAILEAQRDEKVLIRNELLLELQRIRVNIGTQSYSFSILENPSDARFPFISAVTPNLGTISGGTPVTITGANFVAGTTVKFAGVLAGNITVVDANTITAVTPVFASQGAKDVEVRMPPLTVGGEERNSFLRNGFFATASSLSQNLRPVAVAGIGQSVTLGDVATLNGAASYDENQDAFSYAWKFVVVPQGSSFQVGQALSAIAQPSFTPDVPGIFALELKTKETATTELLESLPSYTTVTAVGVVNSAPVPTAGSISVNAGSSGTTTVLPNDPDLGQAHTFQIQAQATGGIAVVDAQGVATYTPNSGFSGSDSFTVRVTDNGNPALFGDAVVSVTVNAVNQPPVITGLLPIQLTEGSPVRMRYSLLAASNDPDGSIARVAYTFSDVGRAFSSQPAVFSVDHDAVAFGPFSVLANARDNLGAETEFTLNLDLTPYETNLRPVNRVVVDTISGAAPLTVNFDATGTFDPEAQGFNTVRWLWGDGSAEQRGNTELFTNSHTFQNPGTYNVRFRTRDILLGETDTMIRIYAGVTPPAAGTAPTADFKFTPREVLVNTPMTFDGSRSLDPNPNGGTLSYVWNVFEPGCFTQPSAVCVYNTSVAQHTFPFAGNYFPNLNVTNQNGASSGARFEEVLVVNQGHAPRARFFESTNSGVAPFTVDFNAGSGRTYDYDGVIASYNWRFGQNFVPNPVAHNINVVANQTGYTQVLPNDVSDPIEQQLFTYFITNPPTNGTATVDASGLVTYVPNPGFTGSDFMNVNVFDGNFGGQVYIPITVSNDTNNIPQPTASAIHMIENGTATSMVLANDPDVGQTHSFFISTQPTNGVAAIDTQGVVTYTPRVGFLGNDSITVSVFDSNPFPQGIGYVTIPVSVVPALLPGENASYTYAVPGVYFPSLTVLDNDGNKYTTSSMVTVNASLNEIRPLIVDSEDRAEERRMLTNACGGGNGNACQLLGVMYQEDGDTFTANELFARACALGYEPACSLKRNAWFDKAHD